MDQAGSSDDIFDLIGLKMTDKMPFNILWQHLILLLKLLRLVLTELALSVFICLLYHFYRLGLTDTDQCHLGNIPSGT